MKPTYVPNDLQGVRALTIQIQYAQPVSKKATKIHAAQAADAQEPKKLSNHAQRNLAERKKGVSY